MSEFKTIVRVQSDSKSNLVIGEPLGIEYFYETLGNLKAEARFKSGRQEDAQEFLSFLLNRIHDEMVSCLDSLNTNLNKIINIQTENEVVVETEEPDDSDWNVVGKKNRSHIIRRV